MNTRLKQSLLAVLLTLMLGTKLYGLPVGVSYAISTEYGQWEAQSDPAANQWTLTLPGLSIGGACGMECGYDDPTTGGTSLDLQPETVYSCTLIGGSPICWAGIDFSSPSCYDVWISDLDAGTGWIKTSDWEGGYYYGYSVDPDPNGTKFNSGNFLFKIEYNTNTIPVAIWDAKNGTGSPTLFRLTKSGVYQLPNDGITACIAAFTNNVYMGTNYAVTFSLLETNVTGATFSDHQQCCHLDNRNKCRYG